MAGESIKVRDELIKCGFGDAILRIANKERMTLSMLRLMSWSILNLIKDDPYIPIELVSILITNRQLNIYLLLTLFLKLKMMRLLKTV